MAGVAAPELVRLPYAPRPLQRVIHAALDAHRFAAVVCHRRFGKTVLAINHLIRAALRDPKERPRYAYIAPTYRMGKQIAWDYLKHYAGPVDGVTFNESELRVDFPLNGAQVRIYGADNPDALRGIYLDGCVLDEYGLMASNLFSEVLRPLLSDRKGWALFVGTPNGKNQFYDVVQTAQREPGWFHAAYRASETHLIDPRELEEARRVMSEDEYAQEWECSFEASVKGAVYAREVSLAREQGRIGVVPYDPALLVSTDLDIGVDDAMSIVYSQTTQTGQIRVIDYDEVTGKGLDEFARLLRDKPYVYEAHYAPHDIQVREWGGGARTRLDLARSMGLHLSIAPKVQAIADRIYAARSIFPLTYFDERKCARLLECLQHYRWKERTADATGNALPVHDWASHGADAFGQLAYRNPRTARKAEVLAGVALRRAQQDTDPFRWDVTERRGRGGY